MNLVEIDPQARVDTLVRGAPGGEERRRTEYTGTVWFDGRPEITGPALRRSQNAPKGIVMPDKDAAVFLPDSLPYARDKIADAQLSVSAVLQGSGEHGLVLAARAAFVDDPSSAPTWIQLHIQAYGGWPLVVAYRVVALTAPDPMS
jgi:hypothetical protein